MGALCSKVDQGDFPLPDTKNYCSSALGQGYEIPNFCSLAGDAIGKSYRQDYCDKLGDGEWGDNESVHNDCKYNDCNAFQKWDTGCCRGCCGIIGRGVMCIRTDFKGDGTDCCLQDYDGPDSQNTLCFQYNTDEKRTCKPEKRDITATTCQNDVSNFCSGADLDPGDSSWINRWVNPDGTPISGWQPGDDPKKRGCFYALNRNVCGKGECTPQDTIKAQGYGQAQSLMQSVFNRYQSDGFIIGANPGQVGYNSFQDALRNNVCNAYPGLCKSALNSVCSQYTLSDIVNNPELSFWCGCYLADTEYNQYTNTYQVTKECTPPCNRAGVIPLASGNGQPVACRQNVCIIDDVTINLIQSQVAGGLQFEQACGNCGDNGVCSCVISNESLTAVNTQVGGSLVFNQNCVSANCTKVINGQSVSVPCNDFTSNPIATYQSQEYNNANATIKTRNIIILIALVAFLIIIFIALLILRPKFNTIQSPIYVNRRS